MNQTDAEVCETDPGAPVPIGRDEDVGRLDVLVKDTHGVGGGQGLANLGNQLEACV